LRRIRQIDSKLLVILMTAYGTTQTAIEAMKLGAYDYLLKPFDVPKLKDLVPTPSRRRGHEASGVLQPLLETEDYELASWAAASRCSSVQVDRAIGGVRSHGVDHRRKRHGQRARRTGHLPSQQPQRTTFSGRQLRRNSRTLLESELFGHERGAFTGATMQRIGKFEQCNRGTLFLDEIGDMTPATQTKILRVLQSGTFERVGGNQPIKADVRIIAATNKPLEQAVAARQFREDLFYRLNVVRIHIRHCASDGRTFVCW
jgi:two-component system nitrogen regulation response regulator GlnG